MHPRCFTVFIRCVKPKGIAVLDSECRPVGVWKMQRLGSALRAVSLLEVHTGLIKRIVKSDKAAG